MTCSDTINKHFGNASLNFLTDIAVTCISPNATPNDVEAARCLVDVTAFTGPNTSDRHLVLGPGTNLDIVLIDCACRVGVP
jgi:hypothetical protein